MCFKNHSTPHRPARSLITLHGYTAPRGPSQPGAATARTQSKGHGGDEQACGSPIEQGWQHPLQTHHTPQMHADACYPHRRGSRSPSRCMSTTEETHQGKEAPPGASNAAAMDRNQPRCQPPWQPAEVHAQPCGWTLPGQRRGRWMPPRQRGHQVHEETEA